MEKLELKHLAPYLPYELKFVYYDSPIDRYILELKSCSSDYVMCPDTDYNYNYIKPILRPLSDLGKIIEIKGVKFIPIVKLNTDALGMHKYRLFIDKKGNTRLLCDYNQGFDVVTGEKAKEKLISWHFDVFGLIDKGLAIDMNDLK